jgi:hypothetical protein
MRIDKVRVILLSAMIILAATISISIPIGVVIAKEKPAVQTENLSPDGKGQPVDDSKTPSDKHQDMCTVGGPNSCNGPEASKPLSQKGVKSGCLEKTKLIEALTKQTSIPSEYVNVYESTPCSDFLSSSNSTGITAAKTMDSLGWFYGLGDQVSKKLANVVER